MVNISTKIFAKLHNEFNYFCKEMFRYFHITKKVNYSVDSLQGLFPFNLIGSAFSYKGAEIGWLTRIIAQYFTTDEE